MENIINSRWKSFLVRFAIFFPIFLVSRLLFGAGLIRLIIAYLIATWIDPVRRARTRQKKQQNLEQIFR